MLTAFSSGNFHNLFIGVSGTNGIQGRIGRPGERGRPGTPGRKGDPGFCDCPEVFQQYYGARKDPEGSKVAITYTMWGSSICPYSSTILYAGMLDIDILKIIFESNTEVHI